MLVTTKKFGVCSEKCICNTCEKVTACSECDYLEFADSIGGPVNCSDGGVYDCPFHVSLKGTKDMDAGSARRFAMELVSLTYSCNDIFRECEKRGISINSKTRDEAEMILCKALVEEFTASQ